MDMIVDIINSIDAFVWGPPMLVLLLGSHIFLTFRTGFIQRKLPTAIKLSVTKDPDAPGDISQFGALCTALSATIGTGNIVVNSMTRVDIPVLKDIPVVGKLFLTDTYPTTWFVLAILIVSWFVIERTPFGLRLRSCGEFPEAADAAGISVARIRYAGVLLSGACAGLGGAIYTVTTAGQCNGSVDGLGFLALAGLIFGQWKPFRILAATLFFGFAVTMAQISMLLPSFASVPPLALKVFPYVVTMLALVVFSKSSQAPRAEGKFFEYKKT